MKTVNTGYYDEYDRWIPNQWWYNYFHTVAKEEYPVDLDILKKRLIDWNATIDAKQQIHFKSEKDYAWFLLTWE